MTFMLVGMIVLGVQDSNHGGLHGLTAFVANLARCINRRRSIIEEFDIHGGLSMGIPFDFKVGSFDAGAWSAAPHRQGDVAIRDVSNRLELLLGVHNCSHWKAGDPYQRHFGRNLKVSDVGGSVSHLLIWQDMVNSGLKHALVVEDDIVLKVSVGQFWEHVATILANTSAQWDIVYIDYKALHRSTESVKVGREASSQPGLHEGCFGTTAAYLINQRAAKKLIQLKQEICSHFMNVDDVLTSLSGRWCPKGWDAAARLFAEAVGTPPYRVLRSFALNDRITEQQSQKKKEASSSKSKLIRHVVDFANTFAVIRSTSTRGRRKKSFRRPNFT